MEAKQEAEKIDYIMPYLQDLVQRENERRVEWVESEERGVMNPSDPVVITVARGDGIIMEAEGSYDIRVSHESGRTMVTIKDCCSGRVLCNRLDIEYMTVNMPFIGIQARKD